MADHDTTIPPGADDDAPILPGGDPGDRVSDEAEEKKTFARRVLGIVAVSLLSLIGFVVVLLILFVFALQTNWGGTHFADFLVTLANPFSEAETEYDELVGNFVTRIELRDLRMYRLDTVYVDTVYTEDSNVPVVRHVRKDSVRSHVELAMFDSLFVDTLQLAVMDTFRLRYNLFALLTRKAHIRELFVSNPVFRARQRADSTWDLLEPFGADTSATDKSTFTVRLDELRITNGQLFAIYNPPNRDSVLQVENFNIVGKEMVFTEDVNLTIDTLYARYMPAGYDHWTDLRAGAQLIDGWLDVTGLEVESPYSNVSARGRLQLPTKEEIETEEDVEMRNIDFRLSANPISFRDLRTFIPSLYPERSAVVNLRATGTSSLMNIDGSADLSDGGSIRFNGSISPRRDDPVRYSGDAEIRRLSPAFFTSAEVDRSTVLNANLSLDLEGTEPKLLDGTITAEIFESTAGGFPLERVTASAAFSDGEAAVDLRSTWGGSTITADGTVRPFSELPTYALDGRAIGFNLADLGLTNQQTRLNATFSIEGTGFDPNTSSMSGDMQIARSTVNNYQIDSGRLQLTLADGDMSFGVRFLFPDGLLVANGRADLDDPIRYEVERGRFENVDLAAIMGQDGHSSLNGRFELTGTGTDPEEMSVEASLVMTASTYGQINLSEGAVRLDLENGRLAITADADLGEGGRFDFAAYTRPFDFVPTFHVTRGEFINVNVGALTGNPEQQTNLNGTATFTARGFDPETMTLNGQFQLSGSRVNEQEINSATAVVNLRQGTLGFDIDMVLPEGSVQLAGSAQPFLEAPTYTIEQGSFQNVNLAAFSGNPELQSSLSGTLSVRGTGFDPETMSVQGRVTLTSSRLNQQQISSATISGTLRDGTLDGELVLDVPEGSTRLTLTARPFLDVPTYTIHDGTFGGINISALTGDPSWQTNLAGRIRLSGRGFDPETMTAEGTIELAPSRINDAAIQSGRISGSLSQGVFDLDLNIDFVDGAANVRSRGNMFAAVPGYEAEGTLSNVRIGDLLGIDTLQAVVSATFDVEGRGTDVRTMELGGFIAASDSYYEGADIDSLYTRFDLRAGVLRVDSLMLRSSAADASGNGVIALFDTTTASDFRFIADIKDLAPVRQFVAAEKLQLEEGRLEGRVYGRPGTLRFDVTGNIRSLIYDNIRLAGFEGTIAGEIGPDRTLTVAEIEGRFSSVSLPQFVVNSANLNISYTPEGIAFDGRVEIDRNRTADIVGRVETAPDQRRIVLEQLALQIDGDHWELLQEASITYGDEYRVSNLLLHSGNQQIAVDGVIDPNGQQNLVVTIENFKFGAIADLLGFEGLQGVVTGAIILTGPAEAPNLSGSLSTDLASFNQEVGDLNLTLNYENLRLNTNALLTHVDGSTLLVRGYVPLDLRVSRLQEGSAAGDLLDESVSFTVVADSFNVGWIDPFLDPDVVSGFEGRLAGTFNVTGTIDAPVVSGQARYVNGRIGLPELGLTYRNINATFELEQNNVNVTDFLIESGDGTLRGSGTINLAQLTLGEFNIDLQAENFLAINSTEYEFVIAGDLQLSGTTKLPVIRGNIDLVRGEIFVTEETTSPELERVQLTDEDLQTVEQRFGIHIEAADTTTYSLYNALAMDLDVNIDRDMWVRSNVNPVMNIQFEGDIDLTKNHLEEARVFGTIEVVPQHSTIIQFGKRFELSSGTLTFNGPMDDPYIDFEARYTVRTPTGASDRGPIIILSIDGRMSQELDLTLGSDPQMDQTDVISYLATGAPASSDLHLGGQALATGQYLAAEQLSAMISGIAGSGLGLDVVTVEFDPFDNRLVLTAGEYLTSRFFVSVSQAVSGAADAVTAGAGSNPYAPRVTIEYELRNWLLLRLLNKGSHLRLNLLYEFSY